ncbi:MAG: hypothetical protein ACFFAS_15875 [Promethearchaeota archaeon]
MALKDVFICEGRAKMVIMPEVHLTHMDIRQELIRFIGVSKLMYNIYKNDKNYYLEVPLLNISKVYKSKYNLAHTAIIETYNGMMYTLMQVSSRNMFGKRGATLIVKTLNYIISRVSDRSISGALNSKISKTLYCPYCGNEIIPDSKMCDECGSKLS